ncbi:MAG: hypothetical protein ISR96_05715 [Nitrospira sp.]|nr:hypothetical protein [bacterium]MBL7048996.1 hypothetical protein [Nitrospira sp.]
MADTNEHAKKTIYFVRNLYLPQNATDKYKELFYHYWDEVEQHISELEKKHKVARIFCESIYMPWEDAMKVLSSMNPKLQQLMQKRIDSGAIFQPLEDQEIFGTYVDWNNCMMLVRTASVYEKIFEFFNEAVKKRAKQIKTLLQAEIKDGEAALIVMRESDLDEIKLGSEFQMVQISTPAYDALLKFIEESRDEKEFWRS